MAFEVQNYEYLIQTGIKQVLYLSQKNVAPLPLYLVL